MSHSMLYKNKMTAIKVCGGGMYFWWELGMLDALQIENAELYTISCGALAGAFHLCRISVDELILKTRAFVLSHGISSFYKLYPLLRRWLECILPHDAHLRCERLNICVLHLPSMCTHIQRRFRSRSTLIDALVSATSIPIHPIFLSHIRQFGVMDHVTNTISIPCNIIVDPRSSRRFRALTMLTMISEGTARELYDTGREDAHRPITGDADVHLNIRAPFPWITQLTCMTGGAVATVLLWRLSSFVFSIYLGWHEVL